MLDEHVRTVLARLEREDASHADPLAQYSAARNTDPTLESVALPLDRGIELSVVLR